MDVMILMVITIFFALVGVVDFCVGTGRWMHRAGSLSGVVLVVEVTEEDQSVEAVLHRAADVAQHASEQGRIPMTVVCQSGGENEKICQSFCLDKGIPLVSQWGEINGVIHR